MSQYKLGKVLVLNNSPLVFGNAAAFWDEIVAGFWFAIRTGNVTYNIQSTLQETSADLWNSGTTYGVQELVSRIVGGVNKLFVAIPNAEANLNKTPESQPAFWMETSGWSLVLTAPYAAESVANSDYCIVRDFSPFLSLPLIAPGDIETGAIYSRSMLMLERAVPTPHRGALIIRDDFIGGRNENGIIGEYGWNYVSLQGASAPEFAELAPAFGCYLLPTGSVTNDTVGLVLAPSNTRIFHNLPTRAWICEWVFFLSGTTAVDLRMGLSDSISGFGGSNFIGMRFNSTQFQYFISLAGVNTPTNSGVVPGTAWHSFRMRCEGGGKVFMSFDGGLELPLTNLPATYLTPVIWIRTNAGAPKAVYLDFFSFVMTGLTR